MEGMILTRMSRPVDPKMREIYDALAKGREILRLAKQGDIDSLPFLDEYGRPVETLNGERFLIGKKPVDA